MSGELEQPGRHLRSLYRYAVAAALAWTLVVGFSLVRNTVRQQEQTRLLALNAARAAFHEDIAVRHWAASHGGVYVPVDGTTPPNPDLAHVPERDLTTPSGRHLTLLNPAYMMRQMSEFTAAQRRLKSHLTSLKPLRGLNAPDAWERAALEALEAGKEEVSEFVVINGETHMRLMRPLVTERSCLKCHAGQGYREGDIRGGLGVTLPVTPYEELEGPAVRTTVLTHACIWLLGLGTIAFGARRARRFILDQWQAARQLKKAKEFTDAVLDSMSDSLYIVDVRDYTITAANRVFLETLGKTEQEVLGRTCHGLTHQCSSPCSGDRVDCPLVDTVRKGVSVACEHVHGDSSETRRHVEVTTSPLRDDHGKITHVVHVDRDLTERRRLEEQLRHSQKMEAVGHLAGGVAHDFNNILTAIMGYGNLLLGRIDAADPGRAYVDQLLASTSRAAGLTQSLLAFSRKQILNPRALDMNETVRRVEQLLRRLIGEDIELRTVLAPQALVIMADVGQVEQVLMNLATNARDAMPSGGTLTIETRAVDVQDAETDGYMEVRPGRYVLVAVSDTGVGMDEATRSNIFEPFFTTKDVGRGTGLGLSIAYGIVKQHNGVIHVYSEPACGSTFKVYLPLAPNGKVAQEPVAPGGGAAPSGTETILLAEDEPMVRDIAREVLEKHGYRVIVATNGEEAVDLFRASPAAVDLLLMDVLMPRKNGREAFEEIQRLRPAIRIIFMSGYTADVIQQRGLLDRPWEIIAKPVSPAELLRRVRAALDA